MDAGADAGTGVARVNGPFWPQAETRPIGKASKEPASVIHIVGKTKLRRRFNIAGILPTMGFELAATPLTDSDYLARTAAVLDSVEAAVDGWLQTDVIDIDSHRTGGLLELSFPNGSKIVLNTQPPLQELWLAARAGGFHFKHASGRWLDTKDGRDFFDVLSTCATAQASAQVLFKPV